MFSYLETVVLYSWSTRAGEGMVQRLTLFVLQKCRLLHFGTCESLMSSCTPLRATPKRWCVCSGTPTWRLFWDLLGSVDWALVYRNVFQLWMNGILHDSLPCSSDLYVQWGPENVCLGFGPHRRWAVSRGYAGWAARTAGTAAAFLFHDHLFLLSYIRQKKHSTSAKVMWVGGASSEHNHCISSGGIAMEIITLASLIPLCWNCTAFHSSSMEDTRTRSVIFRGTQRRSGRWLLSQRTTFCKFGQWYGSMLSVAWPLVSWVPLSGVHCFVLLLWLL